MTLTGHGIDAAKGAGKSSGGGVIPPHPTPTAPGLRRPAPRSQKCNRKNLHYKPPLFIFIPAPSEDTLIVAVKIVFSAATLAYVLGLMLRHSNNRLHQMLMGLGFLLTLGIAVVLVVGVNVFGSTYAPAQWLISVAGGEDGARVVLLIHRGFATVSMGLLIAQIVAGLRRHPLHKRLYKAVIPTWILSYVSGLFLFV